MSKRVALYNEHEAIKRIVIQALGEDVNVTLLEPLASIDFIIKQIHKSKFLDMKTQVI